MDGCPRLSVEMAFLQLNLEKLMFTIFHVFSTLLRFCTNTPDVVLALHERNAGMLGLGSSTYLSSTYIRIDEVRRSKAMVLVENL